MQFSNMAATYIILFTHNKFLLNTVRCQLTTLHRSTHTAAATTTTESTVISEEVNKHTKLAKSWWDPKGPMKALHTMNNVRIPFIKSNLLNEKVINEEQFNSTTPFSKLKILDIGCGGGLLSESLARLGGKVTGIDPSEDLIKIATQHGKENLFQPPNYIQTTIEDFSKDNSANFDVVIMSEVIEHVENKKLFLEKSIETLKPKGSLFITTPQKSILSFLGTIVVAEYILGLVPRGTHHYSQFITPRDLVRILLPLNCVTLNTSGLHYNPLNNHWHIGEDIVFNYAIHAVKLEEPIPFYRIAKQDYE